MSDSRRATGAETSSEKPRSAPSSRRFGWRFHRCRTVLDANVADYGDRPSLGGRLVASRGRGIEHFSKNAHFIDGSRNRNPDGLITKRRDGLDPSRACAPGNPLVQISGTAELGLHGPAVEQLSLHRQHGNHRGVFRKAAAGTDVLVGIGVTIVEIE